MSGRATWCEMRCSFATLPLLRIVVVHLTEMLDALCLKAQSVQAAGAHETWDTPLIVSPR